MDACPVSNLVLLLSTKQRGHSFLKEQSHAQADEVQRITH